MPLFSQWDKVRGQIADLQVPHYYVGPYHLLKWPKAIINPDPCDITYWRPEEINNNKGGTDYIFAYERPSGQPIFIYITPIGADIVKNDYLTELNIDEEALKRLGMDIGKKLGISLGEVLLFISECQITFGAATPHIINTINTPHFKDLTIKALTTALSYDTSQHSLPIEPAIQRYSGNTVVIGSTKDRTTDSVVCSHAFKNNGIFLPLEDLATNWNFIYEDGSLSLLTKEAHMTIIGAIYYRPFGQEDNANSSLALLSACLDNFKGLVYGKLARQYFNSSKPLQLANILPIVSHYNYILFPNTKIIKGINIENIILAERSNYITKSISGIRSIVTNQDEFSMWSKDGVTALPTMFQKQIEGNDVRVHVCHDQIFAVRIANKDRVDYRYSEASFFKETTLHPEVIKFCLLTSYLEQNPLIGIDLIQTTDGYVFLESNPMPGWDYFFKKDASKEKVCYSIMGIKNT